MKIKKQYQEFNKIKKINQKTKANQTDKGHLIFNFYIKQKQFIQFNHSCI